MFRLHNQLFVDSTFVERLDLCVVHLMDNKWWLWAMLVPQRLNMVEMHDLSPADRHTLMEEIALVSRAVQAVSHADKINVGALGNIVPQLHVHVVARRKDDPAWPGPVWGSGHAGRYALADRDAAVVKLRDALAAARGDAPFG